MDIDPRLLRYFLALAHELNFNRAAKRVHLSQPSLSVAIQRLEALCGFKLFERNARSVKLTDRGQRLVVIARDLVERNQAAVASIHRLARGEPTILRVGYSPSLAMDVIGSLRPELPDFPKPIEFVSMPTKAQIKELLSGKLQVGLLISTEQDSPLVIEHLRREPFLVAMPARHLLARRTALSLDDVRTEAVVWLARDVNSALSGRFLGACAEADYAPKVIQEVSTTLECMQFVAQGLGISFGTKALAATGFDAVTFRELKDARFYVDTALAYRADSQFEVFQSFIQFIRARYADH
jgi:DNA-binding transcriptional LysR family regulator